jgi:hypothetical protein
LGQSLKFNKFKRMKFKRMKYILSLLLISSTLLINAQVKVAAHRGASAYVLENSLSLISVVFFLHILRNYHIFK